MLQQLKYQIFKNCKNFKLTQNRVLVITLSTQNNIKLLKQLKSRFKRKINQSIYLKKTNQAQNKYLDFLIDINFQRVNRLVLSLKDINGRESYWQYYLPIVEIKDYVMINGGNFFDQPIKNII